MTPGFIPPHGQYRRLISYRKAEVVYDTEGSQASGTSTETEIRLSGGGALT